jgi:hypothetical protein
VAVVSENLAREIWGAPSAALGKRFIEVPGTPWEEVIGVTIGLAAVSGLTQPMKSPAAALFQKPHLPGTCNLDHRQSVF